MLRVISGEYAAVYRMPLALKAALTIDYALGASAFAPVGRRG